MINPNIAPAKTEIKSLPENYTYHYTLIVDELKPLIEKGLKSVLLFSSIDKNEKDETGS